MNRPPKISPCRAKISLAAVAGGVLLAAICAAPASHAEDVISTAAKEFPKNDCDYTAKGNDCFVSGAEFMDQYCRAVSISSGGDLSRTIGCAKNAEAFLDPMYKEMLKRHKSKAAASAIKDFYAAQLAGLRGIPPTGNESRMTYEVRQASTKQGIRDKRARMELELK